jgi:glycosyltransferase involved in cell wall biosynthesis
MRLFIDLTDLTSWHGNFTGIQRVAWNLASRYARQADVGFMAYDPVQRRFETIDFGDIRHRWEAPHAERIGAPVAVLRRVFDRLPRAVHDLVPTEASRALRKLVARTLGSAPGRQVPLGPDCVVLIPGMGWQHMEMLPALCRLKQKLGFRLAVVIYDLIPAFHPQHYPDAFPLQFRQHMRTVMSETNGLFAISRATASDVQRFCEQEGLSVPDTHVFRLGDSLASVTPVAPEPAPARGEFILSVGLEWRKNALLLYQMVKLAAQQGNRLPLLVIAGRPSWVKGDHEFIMRLLTRDPEVRDGVRVLTCLDDAQLAWLYRHCRFTVYPSVCEGWGLPVAESLRQGKVCLASSASSIPEIGGDLVDYASPFDPRGFLELVLRYLDPRRLAEREAAIRDRYHPHDWDTAFHAFDRMLIGAFGPGSS